MNNNRKFILSEIGICFLPHLLNLLYVFVMINANPDLGYWEHSDYVSGWLLLIIIVIFYVYIVKKHFSIYKKVGLGSIYGALTQVMNIAIHISILRFYYNENIWGNIYLDILLFYFIGLPILFIIIAIIYFKRKKAKEKSGE